MNVELLHPVDPSRPPSKKNIPPENAFFWVPLARGQQASTAQQMSAARRKGSAFARDVCRYLGEALALPVERRVDGGIRDRGDVAGVPGWVLEAKACRQIDLAGWMEEARREAANDGAPFYAVVAKRRMRSTKDAYVVMPLEVWADWWRHR